MARIAIKQCDVEFAWAAGFFDGEGSVYVTRRPRVSGNGMYLMLNLQVVQSGHKCPSTLVRFAEAIGFKGVIWGPLVDKKDSKYHRKPRWGVRLNGRKNVIDAMERLMPYLSDEKRSQWSLAYAEIAGYDLEQQHRLRVA